MLKKTGIVVAAVATGLIGLSPLAFADDWHRGADKVEISEDNDYYYESDSSIDREQYNRCALIQNQESSVDITPGLADGVLPPVGDLPVLGGQSQTGNCTNVGDTIGVGDAAAPVDEEPTPAPAPTP